MAARNTWGWANLDERFAVFHRTRAEGAKLVRSLGGVDLEPLFDESADPHLLERPTASLPAVFVTSVAMARQWMAWGVEPDAMIGHSLGEYVAAHLAGVLSFEDAMMLVVERAALMERASGDDAAMLVVSAPTDEVLPGLPDTLSLATVNADDECVIAGRTDDIAAFEGALRRRGIDTTRIALSAAAHSALLDPVLDEFEKVVRSVDLHRPQRPYVSNLTGTWITDAQATDPSYWVDHLRHTVRFRDGLRTVLEPAGGVVVEFGPGNALSSYARRTGLATGAIPTLRHPDDAIDDTNHTITAFARLWTFGVDVDLEPLIGPDRRRVRLPTYPFQHERCWIEPGAARRERADRTAELLERIDDPAAMTWRPSWRQVDRAPAGTSSVTSWLVVGSGRADEVASELARRGRRVQVASTFDEDDHRGADGIVFVGGGDYDEQYERWVTQMRHAVKVLGRSDQGRLVALTTRAWGGPVQADDAAGALAAGCVLVAPAEMPGLSTALVDDDGAVDIARIVDDIETASGLVSYESGVRRVPHLLHEPPPPAERAPAIDGTWIITGGLGEVGGTLAEYLARRGARLVLVTSSPLPSPAEHDQYLRTHAIDDPTSRKIRRLRHLRAIGSDVSVLVADLDVPGAAAALLDGAEAAVGSIDGVVHAAGRLHDQLIEIADDDTIRSVIDPKARAAVELATELEARGVPRLILVSSTSTRLAPAGQAAYVAANAVLDALAGRHDGLDVTTIGFGMWAGAGMAADTALRRHVGAGTASGMSHPVLGERSEPHDGTVTSWGTLTTEHHWLVDEHRTAAGVAVVPGTGHLELMIAAVQTSPSELVTLDDVALLEPLVVPDGNDVHVRVVVDPPRADPRQVRVEASRDRAGWVLHAEATIGSAQAVSAEAEFDGDRSFDPMSTGHAHLRLGDRWHLPCDAQRTDAAATGMIRAAGPVETEREAWRAHPAVIDQATGWAIALDDSYRRDLLHVPIGYRKVSWMRPLPTEVRVTASRTSDGDADVIVGDLALFDDATVCLAIEGIQLRPIESDRLAATATAPTAVHEGGGDLLDVTERLGLKADDVWPILDDVLTAPQPRTIVSAVDIDALANATFAQDEPAPTEPAPHHDGTVEERLTAIWRDLLGDDRIGPDDDFFSSAVPRRRRLRTVAGSAVSMSTSM
ncbi:MAG: SDR family NAD(P)-dependent oxidoreductase [Ilumatobacteraceae bacterium]